MKPLHLSTVVREGLGPCLRPGGTALTHRLLDLLDPNPASVVLDAGCGTGVSLALIKERGVYKAIGLDLDGELLAEAHFGGHWVAEADLAHLPLPESCLDITICECVWNLTDKQRVLAEFARVLRPGGRLAITDIYSRAVHCVEGGKIRKISWPVSCCFSQATDLCAVEQQVCAAGLTVSRFEDHSNLLKKTAAEFIFVHGSLKGFWQAVTGDSELAAAACEASAATRPGLFLLIAEKTENLKNERIRF